MRGRGRQAHPRVVRASEGMARRSLYVFGPACLASQAAWQHLLLVVSCVPMALLGCIVLVRTHRRPIGIRNCRFGRYLVRVNLFLFAVARRRPFDGAAPGYGRSYDGDAQACSRTCTFAGCAARTLPARRIQVGRGRKKTVDPLEVGALVIIAANVLPACVRDGAPPPAHLVGWRRLGRPHAPPTARRPTTNHAPPRGVVESLVGFAPPASAIVLARLPPRRRDAPRRAGEIGGVLDGPPRSRQGPP